MLASDENDGACPPLQMLPGTLCDGRVFAPLLRHLGPCGHRAVDGDMTGLSSATALAERALAEIDGPIIPVGFSLGAIVALEMALIAPARISAMVLIAANGRDVPIADHAVRRDAGRSDPAQLVGDILWPRSVAAARHDDAALKALIVDMARTQPPATLSLQTEVALTRTDKRPHLAHMAMPVLLLGGAQDQIAPPALQQELAAGLPNATLVTVKDAGHFLPLEQSAKCARVMQDWLTYIKPIA